ncbi:Calsyntenin-2 [Anabarilius grahami]|uniref:Calsyntenin-2 n=1 Tax=Anabarilius grahami TaxID=495550 RepID=A0A3N0YVC1_ANAGA|nr:Calsyntenin-2 [Anabarilius grahami]
MKRILILMLLALGLSCLRAHRVNKHKPWIETSYHGVITENTDVVQLDPPLVALDKDAPVPYADGFDDGEIRSLCGAPAVVRLPVYAKISLWIITINGKMNVWKCERIFPIDTLQQKI